VKIYPEIIAQIRAGLSPTIAAAYGEANLGFYLKQPETPEWANFVAHREIIIPAGGTVDFDFKILAPWGDPESQDYEGVAVNFDRVRSLAISSDCKLTLGPGTAPWTVAALSGYLYHHILTGDLAIDGSARTVSLTNPSANPANVIIMMLGGNIDPSWITLDGDPLLLDGEPLQID